MAGNKRAFLASRHSWRHRALALAAKPTKTGPLLIRVRTRPILELLMKRLLAQRSRYGRVSRAQRSQSDFGDARAPQVPITLLRRNCLINWTGFYIGCPLGGAFLKATRLE